MTKNEKFRVLVVDDEDSIREFLEIMLKREGYAVEVAASAQAAIEKLNQQPVDIVVTDIAMPEMNGIELLGRIKQLRVDMAVIVMTAHGSTNSAVEAMKLGASDYLTKPFQIEEMKIAIQSALKSVAMERENRQLRSQL